MMESPREGRKVRKKIENVFSLVSTRVKIWKKDSSRNDHGPLFDLPADLWYAIMEFLSLYDQIRLLAVCSSFSKRFSLHLRSNNPINRLPWLLEFEISKSNSFTCKLFDPIHEYPYQTLRIQKFCPDYIVSKHGWLLLLREKRRQNYKSVAELFLFCPYTKEIILLPDLVCHLPARVKLCSVSDTTNVTCCLKHHHVKPMATFSMSSPKSEQCVFFVVYYRVEIHTFDISSCQSNSKKWKTCGITIPQLGTPPIRGLEYHEGELYLLVGSHSSLLILVYNHDQIGFRILNIPNWIFNFCYSCFDLLLLDGSLHIVGSDVTLTKIDDDYFQFACYFSKLVRCKIGNNHSMQDGDDFEEKKLENRALFLGTASWDSPFVVEDLTGEELGLLGNKVFYHEECMEFFDMCTQEVEIQRKYFVGGQEEADGAKEFRRMTWIEPPNHVKFSSY